MEKFSLILWILSLVATGVFVSRMLAIITNKKMIWYFPDIIGLIYILYAVIMIDTGADVFRALGYMVMILMVGIFTISNIVCNLIIQFKGKRKTEKAEISEDSKEA